MLNFPKARWPGPCTFIGLIILVPILFLCYQAWFSPRIQFLAPAFNGEWILHPPDELFPAKISGTVLFRRRFELSAVPREATLTVRAASQFELVVNGQAVEPASQPAKANWKSARTFGIAPYLVRSENVIDIRVTNPYGPPALRVHASLADNRLDLDSDNRWESAAEPEFSKWRRCRLTYQEPPVLGGERSPLQESAAYPVYIVFLAVYALMIIAAVKPWRFFSQPPPDLSENGETIPWDRKAEEFRRFPKWAYAAILFAAVAAILTLNFHNAASYPYSRSYFDSDAHIDYVKYVASNWRVPVVTQGWQMYQPPLYYFISAVVYRSMGGEKNEPASLKGVQCVGVFSGLTCLLFAWLTLRLCAKLNRAMKLLGWSAVAFLPMILYINPTISNEMFSGSVMSFSLYLLMRFGFQDRIRFKHVVLLGIVFGLAMLSKYTALLFLLVALFVFFLRVWIHSGHRRRELAVFLIFVTVVCAVCGWFYARNAVLFHNPFVANWDDVSGFHVEQLPGYRTLGFYTRFGSVFTRAPERSRWYSFWDGYHGSMWMDPHFNMIDYKDDRASSFGTIILGLAILPGIAMIAGWIRLFRDICVSRLFKPELALVVAAPLGVLALVWYTMQAPYITTVKAFYSVSLVPTLAVFSGVSLQEMAGNLKKFSPVLYASLIALFALIFYLFWYRPA